VYEVVDPYGVTGCRKPGRRREKLGAYYRYVVNALVAEFDPEDRGSAVGRLAMRRWAVKKMVAHGVRYFDIASHIDDVVLAAVAQVDSVAQLKRHAALLELNECRSW
jgi:hypothetical protein